MLHCDIPFSEGARRNVVFSFLVCDSTFLNELFYVNIFSVENGNIRFAKIQHKPPPGGGEHAHTQQNRNEKK